MKCKFWDKRECKRGIERRVGNIYPLMEECTPCLLMAILRAI